MKRKIVNILWKILVAINFSLFGYSIIIAILGGYWILHLLPFLPLILSIAVINLIFMPIYIRKQNPTEGKKLISLIIIIVSLLPLGLIIITASAFSLASMPSTR